ncbi:MAG TPA: Holliday junction resolvase RuvX [Candidatus Saccharimonadales bacterium]|jgi:putative Holliday junction resolvase
MSEPAVYIGLDAGAKRIGVARGTSLAKLASPLGIVPVDGQEVSAIGRIAHEEHAKAIIVGLPRGLDGQETQQTGTVRQFAKTLEKLNLPIHFQDEAGTSQQAAQENSKPGAYLDDKAAAIMLQDYLDNLSV